MTSRRWEVLRRADYHRMPWKNGGGITHEVATSPADSGLSGFDWRISFAEVADSGAFSTFDGIDRVIMLVNGPGMVLTVDAERHPLVALQPFAFDGASVTSCEVPGPTLDLNVMTRRGRTRATMETVDPALTDHLEGMGDPLVLLAVAGRIEVSDGAGEHAVLDFMDGVRWVAPDSLALTGTGLGAVIRFAADHHGADG